MGMKRDEAHQRYVNKKHSLIVSAIFIIVVLLLVYFTIYSFINLNPVITIVLIVILLVVFIVGVFAFEVTTAREIH